MKVTNTVIRHLQASLLAAICLAALILPLSFTGGTVATPHDRSRSLRGSPLALN